jgi:pimeloyl-ACP methyl ester carboxylesterase
MAVSVTRSSAMTQCGQIEDRFFEARGVPIRYIDVGAGSPVILIHGFGANLDINWIASGFVEQFSKAHRVIAFDVRGHGKSGKPHAEDAYGQEMVEDIGRILDHLGIAGAHIVGYSMGGFLTLKFLADCPQRVRSATIAGSAGIQEDETFAWSSGFATALQAGKNFIDIFANQEAPQTPKLTGEQLAVISQLAISADLRAFIPLLKSWPQLMVSNVALSSNTVPALIVYGSEELAPSREAIERLHDRMRNAEIVEISGAAHIDAMMFPEFKRTIMRFIDRQEMQQTSSESRP